MSPRMPLMVRRKTLVGSVGSLGTTPRNAPRTRRSALWPKRPASPGQVPSPGRMVVGRRRPATGRRARQELLLQRARPPLGPPPVAVSVQILPLPHGPELPLSDHGPHGHRLQRDGVAAMAHATEGVVVLVTQSKKDPVVQLCAYVVVLLYYTRNCEASTKALHLLSMFVRLLG